MAYIRWNSDLDIGIDVIDNQHKRIVEYINKLDQARNDLDKAGISIVLDELVDYTLSHFTFEETLMEEAGYPFIRAHKKVHQLFEKRIADYVQRFKMGEDISVELLNTLRAWLLNHIRNDDKDYADIVMSNMNVLGGKKKGWLNKLFS